MLCVLYIDKDKSNNKFDGWLVGFYGISTLVSYLLPNLVYKYISNIYDL